MPSENISDLIKRLEHLMYGYNYQVTLGIDVFENCPNLDYFKNEFKKKYPLSKPETINLVPISIVDFWEEIDFGFNYRGDKSSGLTLDKKQQDQLEKLLASYKDFIHQYLNEKTKIYYYPDEEGIPGYPVFWDYSFVVQTDNNKFVFVYGSSSD